MQYIKRSNYLVAHLGEEYRDFLKALSETLKGAARELQKLWSRTKLAMSSENNTKKEYLKKKLG